MFNLIFNCSKQSAWNQESTNIWTDERWYRSKIKGSAINCSFSNLYHRGKVKTTWILYNLFQHIAIHAYANWGQNNHISDPFIRRMSKITVLYNFNGGTSFADNCTLFKALGIFSYDFGPLHKQVIQMVAQQKTIKDHKHIIRLKHYSNIVKFIIDLRLKWMVIRMIFRRAP